MQKFRVPQFIDVESKIIGPITTRQFVIMLGGMMVGFISYKLSDFSLFLLSAFIILVLVVAFAFIKVNGAPFHVFLLNYIKTIKSPRVRIWKREPIDKKINNSKEVVATKGDQKNTPERRRFSGSRLSELSLLIDTGGSYKGEDIINQDNEK